MRIALLPLDERPVNAALPAMVAAIAGARAELPPARMLPRMREPGDAAALARWTRSVAHEVDALVVSLDMLGYGGLIASRTSTDGLDAVTARLAVLERVRAERPNLPISAVTTVLRASNSYSAAEEPAYWTEYGRDLHALGADLHRDFLAESNDLAGRYADVPAPVYGDFMRRRLRNHAADLYCLGLASNGVVEPVLVTADDTAERAAGSLEQVWLRHWARALELDQKALSYPGADEVCAALVARALVRSSGVRPRIAAVFPEGGGEQRVAPFENVPVATTAANQIRAAGAELVPAAADADAVLVVHVPDTERRDLTKQAYVGAPDAAADLVRGAVADLDGEVVGLADVRYANGSDPDLIARLVNEGSMCRLAAYGGWNTAGNTIGSVVAALVAGVVGRRSGRFDAEAERRLLVHRVVEDYGYQAVVRSELTARAEFGGHQAVPFTETGTAASYLEEARSRLERARDDLGPVAAGWRLADVRLPWNRTFELDFDVRRS